MTKPRVSRFETCLAVAIALLATAVNVAKTLKVQNSCLFLAARVSVTQEAQPSPGGASSVAPGPVPWGEGPACRSTPDPAQGLRREGQDGEVAAAPRTGSPSDSQAFPQIQQLLQPSAGGWAIHICLLMHKKVCEIDPEFSSNYHC